MISTQWNWLNFPNRFLHGFFEFLIKKLKLELPLHPSFAHCGILLDCLLDRETMAVILRPQLLPSRVGLASFRPLHTFSRMALTNLALAEETLSLSPAERADLARLLIQSLEDDSRTDAEIKDDLTQRLKDLVSGKDSGLTFQEVFGSPL